MSGPRFGLALIAATILVSSQTVCALIKQWTETYPPNSDALESFHSAPLHRDGTMQRRHCVGFIEETVALTEQKSRSICDVRSFAWQRTVLRFERDGGHVGKVAVRVKVVRFVGSRDRDADEVRVEIEGVTASFTVPKTKRLQFQKEQRYWGGINTHDYSEEWVPTPIGASHVNEAMRRCEAEYHQLRVNSIPTK